MGNQRTTQIKTTEANNQRKASVATQPPLSINSPVHPILQLQQQLGNQAVNRLIQTKMTVGQPGDTYEQEADQVAATVMRTPAPQVQRQTEEEEVQTKPITPLVQRQMEEEEEVQTKAITPLAQRQMEEEEEVQTKPITPLVQRQMEEEEEVQAKPITPLVQRQMEEEEEVQAKPITPLVQRQMEEEEENEKVQMLQRQTDEEEEKVQTKAAPGQTPNVSANLEARIQSARGSGQPLSDSTRAFMEPRFGYDFSNVRVHTDDRAASAARDLNAQAFTVGQDIFFGSGRYAPESTVGKQLFAHELVHTLQQQPKSPSAFVAEPSDPEQAPTALEPSLPPLSSEEAGGNKSLDTKTEPEPKTDGGKNDVASQESVETKVEDTEPSLKSTAEESESDVALELEKPSAIGEEEVAEVSSLSLEGASDQALSKFMESSPSEIAATQPNLGTQLDSNLKQEQQAEVENAPTLVAKTSGTVEEGVKAPEQISAGGAEISDGVTQTDPGELKASPPENLGTLPNNKEKEKLVDRQDDNSFLGWFRNNIKGFLSSISTDAGVNTSAGERENVELKGEADPQRMANQQSDAESQLKAQRDMTANTFKQHPGQQNIQPKEVNEEKTAQLSSEAFVSIETPADTGAMDYVNAPLPPDVRNHADKLLKPTLDANLAEAKTQTQDAVKTRDKDKAAKINQAKLDAVAVNQKADKDQRDIVVANRQEVAQQQQEGIDDSYDQVNEFITEADREQVANRKEIGDRVEKSEGEADKELEKGEEKAEKEKEASEKKAADKKKELEKSQEKDSWWDRAVSAVKSAVKAITSAIDDIFTALRDAVKTIIEKAKNAAIALINKARNWVIDKLNKFRDWAKNQVNKYLKDRFPNLAKRINDGIDSVVDTAIEGVNVVADAAIAGVEAVADGLAAGLDKILSVYQTALKAAVQIAGAVITGDFAEALKVALQAACDIAGIDSKPIFDFIDRAAGQVMAILKDPKTFFNNVMEAIGGGVSNFTKNIQQHLIKGLIGWLTGALSEVNLSLPETFDAKGILSLVMQILGLTYENIKAKVIKKFPPAAQVIDGVEKGIEIVQKLVNEGPAALWEEVKQSFSNLKETVISGIQDFVIKTVAKEGIAWLLGLLTPAGAIAKLLKLIFDFVMFLVERFQQIKDFVMSVYNSITAIASGNLSQAKQAVEDALSRSLPVVISLLASLAGLGGIGKTVKNIIGKVAKPVNKIVDKLIDRMVKFAKKLLKKGKRPLLPWLNVKWKKRRRFKPRPLLPWLNVKWKKRR
ncbi:eCIS core domain-containing protein, partial [Okeania hirsuta]|uniref:eCIS core domain-containing protein n=1 Tax=Okeania hirsuta TaxID=1458930 RepID=UPI000F54158C